MMCVLLCFLPWFITQKLCDYDYVIMSDLKCLISYPYSGTSVYTNISVYWVQRVNTQLNIYGATQNGPRDQNLNNGFCRFDRCVFPLSLTEN